MDAGGYDSTLVNWNASDAIPWYLSDFGISPKYKGFTNGFQQVPIALAELFEKDGGEVRLEHQLRGFDYTDGQFTLNFSNEQTIIAGKLILAMPRRASRSDLARESSVKTDPAIDQQCYTQTTVQTLYHLCESVVENSWLYQSCGRVRSVQSGRSVTDLPVRQTYYWPNSDGSPSVNGRAMLLASYDDGNNIGFWDGLRPQRSAA